LIGTINVKYNGKTIETGYTTPDPTTLNLILKDMKSAGVEFVFIEASSHGLKLGRLNGIHLHSVVFTNQTLDHMDFHPDMDDYRRSKFRLFQLLENSVHQEKFALVSLDSPGGQEMRTLVERENFHYPVFYFGKSADYSGENVTLSLTGTSYEIHKASENKSVKIETNLLGNYNYINTAMAYIVCEKSGISSESVCVDLKNISYVNGRFEIISNEARTRIAIVDYAHTPDALMNVLSSIREIPHSRLITIFGCGGDRDKTKRPVMAGISEKFSDFVIITSDNPRTEDPEKIIDDIEKGFSNEFNAYFRTPDRRAAIRKGVSMLPDGGFLLVAGKGHEEYQINGKKKEPFSDREEIQIAFAIPDLSRK
ncbi:MAG: UDP-N-acetylmuramoyl-L-alanyl-D-glutamate--2,6-diaminopimelate ligase, partial [Leptospira sp.]|nr:UDP-N-acetylmuramoyl-L-alanyl-D-glutamate--2,6-diaminopimelate ligase [Leptospira sp.]